MLKLVPAVLVALLVAGSAFAASQPDSKRMVLRVGDLPAGFVRDASSEGYFSAAQAAKSAHKTVAYIQRLGFVRGYETDFTRGSSVSDPISGPTGLISTAVIYRDTRGPKVSLTMARKECRKRGGSFLPTGGGIGDAAMLCSLTAKENGYKLRAFWVAWRDGRIRGTVQVVGVAGAVPRSQAVRLAHKQERRITAEMH